MRRVRAENMYISQSQGSKAKLILLGLCACRVIYPQSITDWQSSVAVSEVYGKHL